MYLLICFFASKRNKCNTDLLFVLSGRRLEVSLSLLLQPPHALPEQVELNAMFAAP